MITIPAPHQIQIKTTPRISRAGITLAWICADWDNNEACVVELAPTADRQELASIINEFWPTLAIVWPEDLIVEEVRE